MQPEPRERRLREIFQRHRQTASGRIGACGARQLDVSCKAVGGQDHPVGIVGLRFAEVDVAVDRTGKRPAFQLHRADLRELRTLGGFGGAEPGLGIRTRDLPVCSVGVEGEPFRHLYGVRPYLRWRWSQGVRELGYFQIDLQTGRGVGLGGGRICCKAWKEAELIAAGGFRPLRLGMGGFTVV